ncbi:MAG: hypothetical protein HY094_07660 [Candidatus Melainabacteria bacterium]|nr:hypothetical protein [Candidatus Melainabacteria bacterium]
MKRIFIYLSLLILIISGCCLVDPLTRAQSLSQKGQFEEAIKMLEKEFKAQPDSIPVKSLLAQAYSDYGLALCQDQNKLPKVKYPMAKEQFAMALALNPYLKDAKDMYEMIEKIQASLSANKLD